MLERRRVRTWAVVLDAVVVVPLLAALLSSPGENSAVTNLCTGLGMLATSLMVVVMLLVSRVRGLTRWLGLELGNDLHKRLGPAAAVAALGHVVTAVLASPRGVALLDPVSTPKPIKAGIIAAVLLTLVAFTVVPRQRVKRYGRTVRVHGVLALAALGYTGIHVLEVGNWTDKPLLALAWVFIALVSGGVLGWRFAVRPIFNRGAYRIGGVRRESDDTATVVLDPVEGRHAAHVEPGQFVWLRRRRLPVLCVEHPFTVAASTRTGILELTVRSRGEFTLELLGLPVGTKIWLDGPHGSFVPAHDGGLVLIAGGVGITPMMSILRAHAATSDPRPHRLLLAEKPTDERLFGPELSHLERRLDLSVCRTLGRRLDRDFLLDTLPPGAREQDYYICGPPGLMVAVLAGLGSLGVPEERIHTEQFG